MSTDRACKPSRFFLVTDFLTVTVNLTNTVTLKLKKREKMQN